MLKTLLALPMFKYVPIRALVRLGSPGKKLIRVLRLSITLCYGRARIDCQVMFLYASKSATNWLLPHRL